MNKYEIQNIILGIPRSLILNYKAFGILGIIRMPILVSRRTHFKGIQKGTITLPSESSFGMVKIGINLGPFNRGLKKETFVYIHGGRLIFDGKANIAADSVINVNGGLVRFGKGFAANNGFICSCEKAIQFRDDVLLGWNCTIIDGDGHKIMDIETGNKINCPQEILIENHVWIASNVTVTKGAVIPHDSIIGEGSLVNRQLEKDHALYVGRPVKQVREKIDWMR